MAPDIIEPLDAELLINVEFTMDWHSTTEPFWGLQLFSKQELTTSRVAICPVLLV